MGTVCFYCRLDKELRPYGPGGQMVCFGCAMATPERRAQTERSFGDQLNACGHVAVSNGTEIGPYPVAADPRLSKVLPSTNTGSN